MLVEVRRAGELRRIVGRARPDPDLDRHQRRQVVLLDDDLHAVGDPGLADGGMGGDPVLRRKHVRAAVLAPPGLAADHERSAGERKHEHGTGERRGSHEPAEPTRRNTGRCQRTRAFSSPAELIAEAGLSGLVM